MVTDLGDWDADIFVVTGQPAPDLCLLPAGHTPPVPRSLQGPMNYSIYSNPDSRLSLISSDVSDLSIRII